MHKSQLAGFIIDCDTDDLDSATDFWSAALGLKSRKFDDPIEDDYRALDTPSGDYHIEVQKVSHPSRVHLDIETDDIAAEVSRLEALGARRLGPIKSWVVMEAPTGQRFCVVRQLRKDFETTANNWK
jgi:predicted enzyme related to lactoylglutathione lyase